MTYHPMAPCPHCERHVRIDERDCPFCGDALASLAPGADTAGRLGRAAAFAFGTTVAVGACAGETVVDDPTGGGTSTSTTTSGTSSATTGGAGGMGGDPSGAGGLQTLYGGPPQGGFGGAGGDASGVGGFQAEYGAPPPPPDP